MIKTIIIIMFIILGGIAGYRERSLSGNGATAAVIVGSAVFLGFGIKGLILLGLFFITSSLWSKYKSSVKKDIEEKIAKGATRDWRQVAANGGSAALISIIYYFQQDLFWLIGFIVCLASANSDTWASEIGTLSKRKPVYIRTFKPIDKGTSGAVSSLGTTAAIFGSMLIALAGTWLFHLQLFHFFIIFLFGFLGNVIDTLFGAFYQQVYICTICGIETEKKVHCQKAGKRIKGFHIVDNDMVNFLSGLIAALLSMIVIYYVTIR
ncbi:uncharacterized protein (TIGR00297 family) [Neobacillus niacini]|jgi:uncharacterized protein (TIGR00297 family)|uniref:DUF92 domain-containing protein n=1 Tax=Neobacillus niacini TaxID=86668 RepID=UPI0027885271|nr:DUF92 domain-containing protein [Neobacillus niacini]MDQ1001508.1 uncharacterized protein (TIGR00297 family) [Neobacillus niacini]